MKLKKFRSYNTEVEIDFGNITAFVGKNDVGKSTILEALDIFLSGGIVKLDKNDVNKQNKEDDEEIQISVMFDDVPDSVILDETNPTSFKDEYLLNRDDKLEIIKKYQGGKEKVFLKAYHPTNPNCIDLLHKKINDLQKIVTDNNIACSDKTKKAELRKAIREHNSDSLKLQDSELELNKEDAKSIWEQLQKYMPLYALFQSDRSNDDGDNEIQDPIKFAIREVLQDDEISKSLKRVAEKITDELQKVTNTTIEKLKEMNPSIVQSLNPNIPSAEQLKWGDVFKNVSIVGDKDIPINKRGSGVKRLILLNFFRAEVERKKDRESKQSIIYAIEEPETSQHQEHQRLLVKSLVQLSKQNGIQVILTTHSPTIVKGLKFDNLRVIKNGNDGEKQIVKIDEASLPIPSLNEVNFLAFGEADEEYHNELYGYIEKEGIIEEYKNTTTDKRKYIKIGKNNCRKTITLILTEYIRHQIHHPENELNTRFTKEELHQSIKKMRDFIINKNN